MNSCSKRPRNIGKICDSSLDLSTASLPTSENHNHDFNALVAGIQSAITTKQRLSAFTKLRRILQKKHESENDHSFNSSILSHCKDIQKIQLCNTGNVSLHSGNFEDFVNAGGINALILQLHHLVHSHGSTLPELELLCYCLSLLLRLVRRKQDRVERFMCDQDSDFLVLLSSSSLLASQKRQTLNSCTNQSIPSVQHSTMTIFYIITSSSVGATIFLKCQVAVELVARILGDSEIDDDSVYEALGIYKNLTYYQEDCRVKLIKSSGFIQSLTSNNKKMSFKSRQRQLTVIRNLSISIECRSLLVAQPAIVGTLIQSLLWEPHSIADLESSDFRNMRRNIFNTLVSLTMDHDSALLLIFYGDGILLRILQRFLKDSIDTFLRKKSACVMRLLTNEISAPLLVHDATLMYSLADAALRDESSDVRREAAEAFARCAAYVQLEQQPHYDNVLDALTVLVNRQGPRKTVAINSLARALKEQSFHACNQRPMAKRGVLIEAIAQIALLREFDSTSAANDACCALMNLSTDEENVEALVNNPTVLEALLSNASSYAADFDEKKAHALSTLVNLTQSSNCRLAMIRHGYLLQTLIHEAKFIPIEQRDLKRKLKKAILLLASDL